MISGSIAETRGLGYRGDFVGVGRGGKAPLAKLNSYESSWRDVSVHT